jgi:hypothetical protein
MLNFKKINLSGLTRLYNKPFKAENVVWLILNDRFQPKRIMRYNYVMGDWQILRTIKM